MSARDCLPLRHRDTATLTIELFGPARQPDAQERDALTAEAGRVLAFGAPGAAHEVRFAPLAEATVRNP